MNRKVTPCPMGARGADLSTKVTAEEAAAFAVAGFEFLVRYLPITTPNNGDLSAAEVAGVLGAGLGLMAVQHVRFAVWRPSAELGSSDGGAAARNAATCGLPPGATLWVDLEGVHVDTTASEVAAYANAWAHAVLSAGYDAGAYVGAGLPAGLDEQALWKLEVKRYWRSQSQVPNVACRGYQLLQLSPQCRVSEVFPFAPALVRDVMIDVDVAQADYRGIRPTMIVAT